VDESRPGTHRDAGLLAGLRKLATTLVDLLRTRLGLLAAELEEERGRIVRFLVLALSAGFFLALGIVSLTFFVILLAWDTRPVLVAGLLTAAYLVIGAILAVKARNLIFTRSGLFSESLAELRKDHDELTRPGSHG
jgi:uncharacterized membrane protein YqjE